MQYYIINHPPAVSIIAPGILYQHKLFLMKFFILLSAVMLCIFIAQGQHRLQAVIKDNNSHEILTGASVVLNAGKASLANAKGFIQFQNMPAGTHTLVTSYTGYETRTDTFTIPLPNNDTLTIYLTPNDETLDEVIVQSTRTSRTIANTPTRVETIDGEELDEKNNMRPANVSMLLHESTGLQVQQTAAVSGNASIRVQGLDGRYTQLLKDGYPNFGNFASGLSVLEIPPLDLRQVEIIKGPASTLYGGGAIAGVINFISALPKEKPVYNFIINQSNVGQTNLGAYASHKKGKWGYALLAQANFQKTYDVDKDEFTELPRSKNFTVHPRLFYYPDASTTIMIGNSFTKGHNTGGDIPAINGKSDSNHVYFEDNKTLRNITTLEVARKFAAGSNIKLKQSLSIFTRTIAIPGYVFAGTGTNSFTDLSYLFTSGHHTVIAGINLVADKFRQKDTGSQNIQSFTAGIYVQDTWDISNHIKIESGIRADNARYSNIYYKKNQGFILPRVSVLFKINDQLSSRIGGGLGYKLPTIFTEQTEAIQYQQLLPLNNVTAEKSIGTTADINYKTRLTDQLFISINQMFFFTKINRPLLLENNGTADVAFINAAQPVTTRGFETNLKFIFKDHLKLFAGYTFTDAKATYKSGNQVLPLLPKDKLNLSLVYEKEENFKAGLEAYLTGHQFLYNGNQTPSFWEFGAMAEKTFGKLAVFINFENFTDQRQSKYKTVVNPPHNRPVFDDIWNHTEGFVINGGVKIKL